MTDKIFQNRLIEGLNKFHDKIAIEHDHRFLSYAELDKRSNHIAQWMINKGIEKETFIGVLMDDKMNLVVTMIGILKAGCVFIPLDTDLPVNRIRIMLKSTGTKFVITDRSAGLYDFSAGADDTLAMQNRGTEFFPMEDIFPTEGASLFIDPPVVQYRPEDKIYVYFTSGTTGEPRAIVGKNKSLLHFIDWEITTFGIDETFLFSQFTNPGFDAYLRDTFVPLCAGGRVCIPVNKEIMLNAKELVNWIDKTGINGIHCVPSLFRQISAGDLTPERFQALKFIFLSGEKINPPDLEDWYAVFAERIQLVNFYGPTETTMIKTYYLIRASDAEAERIPVGKPMKGARVIVLNKNMKICKPMVVGDIYIRTPYRTFGYYNEPALNKERFILNPFGNDPDDLIHKTGDLGRLLPDGNLEVLGRSDRQVKIRGIRIELEEIENVLLKHPTVEEAVVVKVDLPHHNGFLCAYITGEDKDKPEETWLNGVKEYLAGKMPDYMMPGKIVNMDKIPRNPTGKVDYNRLPDPMRDAQDYIPPRDEVESKLVELWSEALEIPKKEIGIHCHFFEMGGNSLNVMMLNARIHKEFDITISMEEIFDNPTIEEQAKVICKSKKEKYFTIENVELKEYYEMSSAQKRMYITWQLDTENISFNMPRVVDLEGPLNIKRLQSAFIQLIRRHEGFRTSFEMVEGLPVQRVHSFEELEFEIDVLGGVSLRPMAPASEMEINKIIDTFIRPFDLSQPPLLRVGVIKITDTSHVLLVDMHHIISDAVSSGIFIGETIAISLGKELPPLRIQYKDFSHWQNRRKKSRRLKRQEEYWLSEFSGDIPVLDLPLDFERPKSQSLEGDTLEFGIDAREVKALNKMAREENVTLYMMILAIFTLLLSKLSGQEDIIVGTAIAGRGHEDVHYTAGMFVNMIPQRNFPAANLGFKDFLKNVRERTLKAFENQDYQFDDLVNQLYRDRKPGQTPVFSVVYDELRDRVKPGNAGETGLKKPPGSMLNFRPSRLEKQISKYDLQLRSFVSEDILFKITYCTRLFKKETIERYIKYFKEIVKIVLEDNNIRLSDISITHDLIPVESSSLKDYQDDFDF
jgi:amino acid adenylation domain-containing protein